jgi:transketolase
LAYAEALPDLAAELQGRLRGDLPAGWDADIPIFPADTQGMATRVAGGQVMNAIAPRLPALFGGARRLPALRCDFFIFSDYMRPAIRLAALMGLHEVFVFTHDSIGVGEDGPTHQPVEQLASLRAMPGLMLIRPADANETAVAWKVAVEARDRPVLLVLTRQDLPTLDRSQYASADGLRRGAYVVWESPGTATANATRSEPELILLASGSELTLILAAAERLHAEGIAVRCVSMPSWDLFDAKPQRYRDQVLPPTVRARLAVELGAVQGWHRYVSDQGEVMGIERFGASAPAGVLMQEFGFTTDDVLARARRLLDVRNASEGAYVS